MASSLIRAILNPSKLVRSLLVDAEDKSTETSFSTNYISLQTSGPEVADLSFVDLPKVTASVSHGGNEWDIAMWTLKTKAHTRNMSQTTIAGILHGDAENFFHLSTTSRNPKNKWYCIKQPILQDLKQGITWEARARENNFSQAPLWSKLNPFYQKRLRTSNLIDWLNSILSDPISKGYISSAFPHLSNVSCLLTSNISSAEKATDIICGVITV
ncbi:hypothetical protein B0H14DRAFT_2559446 [Mycena olivaceomarginata]|nr:hypothetical protein B0H14DRAFT_2559446 [Mycena olivaceomarginata]